LIFFQLPVNLEDDALLLEKPIGANILSDTTAPMPGNTRKNFLRARCLFVGARRLRKYIHKQRPEMKAVLNLLRDAGLNDRQITTYSKKFYTNKEMYLASAG
jgi:hypothetical protein